MTNTDRPVTVTAVEASLRADADFRGILEHAQVHYLLGMCEARLADANREIERLQLQHAPVLLDALREVADVLDDYADVIDGDDSTPRPNRAMSALMAVNEVIAKVEKVRR